MKFSFVLPYRRLFGNIYLHIMPKSFTTYQRLNVAFVYGFQASSCDNRSSDTFSRINWPREYFCNPTTYLILNFGTADWRWRRHTFIGSCTQPVHNCIFPERMKAKLNSTTKDSWNNINYFFMTHKPLGIDATNKDKQWIGSIQFDDSSTQLLLPLAAPNGWKSMQMSAEFEVKRKRQTKYF